MVLVWGVSSSYAKVLNVNTSQMLQSALDTAVAGDEIVLANGTYTGQFTINGAAGTANAPITIRAAHPRQAVLVGDNVCNRFHEGFIIQKPYWVIKDLKFRDHGRSMSVYADHVEIVNNVIEHFREEGIRVDGVNQGRVQFANIHENIVANGDACPNTDSPGIYLVRNVDNSTVTNNIIVATGDNGYICGGVGGCSVGNKFGYGMLIANDSDDNTVQGNLFLGNGGKGVFRILSNGVNSTTSNRNMVRDNAFLFGEGAGAVSDDCNDDSNQFLNNIAYGNYFWNWYTKGNLPGTTGHHTVQHNLFYATDFTRGNTGFLITDPSCASPSAVSYKLANTLKDNLFYSNGAQAGGVDTRILLTLQGPQNQILAQTDHNLFWAPGNTSTWISNYSYHGTDIHSSSQQPIFADPAHGDFSLAAGSPGKGAASDGGDIGIQYNSYLKKTWLRNAFTLPTQQKDNLTTSASFTVDSTHFYQIWFYIPTTPYQGVETFNVEGMSLQRDIKTLTSDTTWTQPNGPARWITLGRAKAADGTLNISWSNPGSASKIFIRQLPTADEAAQWLFGTGQFPPPKGLRVLQVQY
jgi:hypothetical protein